MDVFGYAQEYDGSASNIQAHAVTPPNGTLVDLDYWDTEDDYTQSATDYDKFDWTITKVRIK